MSASQLVSASQEDYLEAIYHLVARNKTARVKDIASRLRVKKSSVTGALKALTEKKLINYAPYEHITLTKRGQKIALDVVHRHEVLRDFFIKVLALDKLVADSAACKMEHEISREILERFVQFVDFIDSCPRMDIEWINEIGYHCKHETGHKQCVKCMEECLSGLKSN